MKKLILFVLLFVAAVTLTAYATNNPGLGIVAGLVSSAIFTVFVEDFLDDFKTWLSIPIRTSKLSIFLYGRGGSGKTTFINHILSLEDLRNKYHSSTEYAEYYRGLLSYSPNAGKRFNKKYSIPVHIADYKGQAPKQALGLSRNFKSQVNAILFIVDIVHPDPKSDGNAMDDNALIEWLASDTEEKINDRVIQHVAYVGDAILSIIFSELLSTNKNNLRSVRLVINKVDIVQKLMAKGYLSNASSSGLSAEDYVRKKFKPIEQYIREACSQNGIADVYVETVSLTEGTRVRDLIQGLIKVHFQALRIS